MMKNRLIVGLLFLFAFLRSGYLAAQSISGVINTYTKVTALTNPGCECGNIEPTCLNSITVVSGAGFSIGDKVMIIQMKGATINTTNTSSSGTITDIGDAGNYELFTVGAVSGNTITTKSPLGRTYDPVGLVQLVRIPSYTDVTVSGTLTADPWNPATGTGGVLALVATGTITLNANIDASGLGYTGIDVTANGTPDNCSITPSTQYTQAFSAGGSAVEKGNGIVLDDASTNSGRAPRANGGGGGVSGDSGGGGGSNYGAGGVGGNRWCDQVTAAGGLGGIALATYVEQNKLFMGGAGGAGYVTTNNPSSAADGGGVILIKANTLIGNGHSILAAGTSPVAVTPTGAPDGGGGGGGGGAIALILDSFSGTLGVDVSGGNGQTLNTDIIHGPGGGGGGGVLFHMFSSLPGGITVDYSGGAAGTHSGAQASNTNGATNGSAGGIVQNFLLGSFCDGDGDGSLDRYDIDDDNDGIPDYVEVCGTGASSFTCAANLGGGDPSLDSDLDGIPNYADADYCTLNAAGICSYLDSDVDGIPDFLDLDSDNDGIPDIVEAGGIDTNGDGKVDDISVGGVLLTDVDEDGLSDTYDYLEGAVTGGSTLPVADSDGDGLADFLDLDADNDGIPDLIEAGGIDTNGDGRVDVTTDVDADGLADLYDENAADGPANNGTDGTALVETSADSNADGLRNGSEGLFNGAGKSTDLDGDGLPNHLDLDADNDGILDIVEADGPSADTNGDGYVDDYNPGTGLFGGSGDADGDGYSNEYDSDTNNDGSIDNAQSLSSGAWVSGPLLLTGADTDSDGLPDSYGNGDTDSDVHPNFLDVDADNDGILDNIEAQATGQAGTQAYVANALTVDSKGVPTPYATYTNYDTDNSSSLGTSYGIHPYDHDGDGIPDYKDTDSDDDGDPDVDEAWDSNLDGDGASEYSCTTDIDGDGLLTCFDADDNDATVLTNANNPPVDNGFESTVGNGATAASTFASLNGTSVLYYDVYPNNSGDFGDIQPDWRDDNSGCVTGAGLQYPITGTDAIFFGGTHISSPGSTNGSIRAMDYCEGLIEAGWKYYFDPINPAKVLFSIEHGANTTQIEYIEMRRDNTSGRMVTDTVGGNGYFVMARDWFVQTVDDAALTANVNIRFYYDPADSTSMETQADNFSGYVNRAKSTPVWFKTDDQFTNGDIAADDGLGGMTGYVIMTPAAYGAEGGIHYVQFNNISSFSGGGLGVSVEGTLPVEWLSFEATQVDAGALLSWSTASEQNTDHYEVERSSDGRLYQSVGRVTAAGNSLQTLSYQYLDTWTSAFPRVLYRLKQVDQDGGFSYSQVVELSLENSGQLGLTAYPNPAREVVMVEMIGDPGAEAQLLVQELTGKEISVLTISLPQGKQQLELDVSEWARGVYFLTLRQGSQRKVHKLSLD